MNTRFKKGQSGNPSGKPKGATDRRTALRELLKPYAADLVAKVVTMAKEGDIGALRICIDRIIPPAKEDPVSVKLPKIAGAEDCTKAQAAVLNAVAAGEMLPGEGQAVSALIENQRRAYETTELSKRLEAIEAQLTTRKTKP